MVMLETVKKYLRTGWVEPEDILEAWVYASADAPTFTFTITGDATSRYSVGMKIRLTQTTVKYFIITAISYSSPNTTVTIYGGTDYTLTDATITSPFVSTMKSPYGFPTNPAKWSVTTIDTTLREKASATDLAYYYSDLGSINISVPIGVWRIRYDVAIRGIPNSPTTVQLWTALSTSTSSFSDADLTCWVGTSCAGITDRQKREKIITATSKTSYYLIGRVSQGGGLLRFENSPHNCILQATCVYL